ncbi:DNA helicase-2/ATP-dependent DNA helicase PcrA [Mycoplasmopsis mustelae]|uniref:DNA 3'-5' helicase n=1 Tax=Mycoplasmopsis mustelae TaxID=171289 RepID=A0A4R7UC55_9BACT|nr:UvrD-helicase domain-containing protein [Mycoplasmopsis mustelae]TDV23268.1 DNA helicase-2/ATP-dependent DNA helicase PcrA [Mycoplasmopsis mustelae]
MTLNYKKLDLLGDLNEHQSETVRYFDSPLRIIAGAGTGKTKVLTRKVSYLINVLGISPKKILAVTFTNKAAQEMSVRIKKYCRENNEKLNIMTFHSFCANILRREIHNLGYNNNFTILDENDKNMILSNVYKELGITINEVSYKNAIQYISYVKNFNKDIRDLYKNKNSDGILNDIYIQYTNYLAKNGALDFDDLILQTSILFDERPDILMRYKNNYDYILIDEFQDTSVLQYNIIKKIISENTHLTIVGDPDQTIYNWRGADVNLILNFDKDFPNSKTVVLDKNYRSTKVILDAANKLIKHNKNRFNKDLVTDNEVGAKIKYMHSFSEDAEARWVVNEINQLKKEKNQLKSIAILYRSNFYSRAFEQSLIEEGVPHRILNGIKFYQRSEIKDAIAFLRVIFNGHELSMQRIINVPNRGIGETALQNISSFLDSKNEISTLEGLYKNWNQFREEYESIAKKMYGFIKLTLSYRTQLLKNNMKIHRVLNFYLKEIDYYKFIEKNKSLRGTAEENVKELINSIAIWETKNPDKKVEDYLNYINFLSVTDETDGNTNYVTLMTVHSAKGLEYDNIFLVGMSKGVFPTWRIYQDNSIADLDTLEEERRLAYVAVTRAKKRLFISSSRGKIIGTKIDKEPSQFVREIGINTEDGILAGSKAGLDLSENSQEEIISMNSKMVIGDLISHVIFGEGEVIDLGENNNAVIKFSDGSIKTLNKIHHSIRILRER